MRWIRPELTSLLQLRGCRPQMSSAHFFVAAGAWTVATSSCLLSSPANCHEVPLDGQVPSALLSEELVAAAKRGRIDRIAAALEPDPDLRRLTPAPLSVDATALGGRTLLSYAVEREGNLALSRWMLEHGADPNTSDQRGRSALAVAACKDCVQTVLLLLRHGASAINYDVYGLAPLHKAAGFGCTGVVKVLLQVAKVSPDLPTIAVTAPASHEAQPSNHETALHIAARVGHEEVVDALLREGADPNATNIHGDAPLHCACNRGHTRTIQRLLRGGARIDMCNGTGSTPCDAMQAGWLLPKLVTSGVLKWLPKGMFGRDRLGDSDFS